MRFIARHIAVLSLLLRQHIPRPNQIASERGADRPQDGWRVARQGGDFSQIFGANWRQKLKPEQTRNMLKARWMWEIPDAPEPGWERDLPFWTIPGTDRKLLCDLWQPPASVPRSGLAFIYFHGSGWHLLDKDFRTRFFFRHLAAQGHVVMDVAYRMCPETELTGMVGDVRRAIAWMKTNAATYGVDPARIVIGGGSAGGHLTLLAAYTDKHPQLTPDELKDVDTSACGVILYYGPTDMRAYYEHAGKMMGFAGKPPGDSSFTAIAEKMTVGMMASMAASNPNAKLDFGSLNHVGMMRNLFGGKPDKVPEACELGSLIVHVGAHCPPTLMLYGEHDCFVSAEAARAMYHSLREAGVPAMYVEFPQTDHAFDLTILPRYAPAAQAALYHVERFLALMASAEIAAKATPSERV